MRLRDYVPLPIRRGIRHILNVTGAQPRPSPIDVVKANTRDAFDCFYRQDDFISQHYLEPKRLSFYDILADYCVHVVRDSDIPGALRIADIGCGTGHMLAVLQHKLSPQYDLELFGLDFAPSAIDRARRLLPSATFVIEDIYRPTIPPDSFDLVLCIETLEHLRWPERALDQLYCMCRPGGAIVLTVPNGEKDSWDGHVHFWNLEQFTELLLPYGLRDVRMLQEDTVMVARLAKANDA